MSHGSLVQQFNRYHEAELLLLFDEYQLQPTDFNLRHSNVKASHQSLFQLYGSRPDLVCE